MPHDLPPLHDDLTFVSPLSGERATGLCRFVADHAGAGPVVDIGCGWGELLIQVLALDPALSAVGIDLDPDTIQHGIDRATARGVGDRLQLLVGDAKDLLPSEIGAVFSIGAGHVWGPPLEEGQPLDYRAALANIRAHVDRSDPVVFGDGIWTAPPTPAAIAPLGGRTDEFVFLPQLVDIAVDSGFEVFGIHQADLDEWDRFESGFTAGYVRWLASHPPDHPQAGVVRDRLRAMQGRYLNGYRGILGFAYLQLIAV